MKKLGILFICVFSFLAALLFGVGCGLAISDKQAYKSAINEDYLELYECVIEQDYNCDIEYYDYHNVKKGEVTYFCVSNYDESHYFFVRLELKKVAPFRYEWVEVDL